MASDVELRARTRLARVVSYVPGRKRVFELVDVRFKSKGDTAPETGPFCVVLLRAASDAKRPAKCLILAPEDTPKADIGTRSRNLRYVPKGRLFHAKENPRTLSEGWFSKCWPVELIIQPDAHDVDV
jgi:hypothetical protein